jgi:chromosome partitioning protein
MIIAPHRDDLNQIVILNPKGGCGKTTLATNLASRFAIRGSRPMLIDNDPNGYTSRWLEKRPQTSRKIYGIASGKIALHTRRAQPLRIPNEIDTVIIDTPAALGLQDISELTYNADCILVPILPSVFDTQSATNFVAELLLLTQFERPIAVVANRTRQNTKSLAMLMRTLANFETPTIAVLRNSQNYVHAADMGLGIYEIPYQRAKKDVKQMERVVNWLDRQLMKTWEPGLISPVAFQPKLRVESGYL